MSHDLFFYRPEKQSFDIESVADFFRNRLYFKKPKMLKDGFQIWYEHPNTGVYFSFDYAPPGEDSSIEVSAPLDHCNTGITFTLNYIRPSFFAYEAIPEVEAFAETFRLVVLDPQSDPGDKPNQPGLIRADDLIASWQAGNTAAVKIHQIQGTPPHYMNAEKTHLWWRYMQRIPELQEQLAQQAFVPEIFLFQRQTEKELFTAVTWTDAIPQVFPQTDYIIIVRQKPGLLNSLRKPEIGFIAAKSLYRQISDYLEAFHGPVPHMQILKPEKAKLTNNIFATLTTDELSDIERIAPDQFVDVRP